MDAAPSPQPLVVGEAIQTTQKTQTNSHPQQTYSSIMQQTKISATTSSKLDLFPVHVIQGEPVVEFTTEDVNRFTIEEGLHQAVILKFSYGKPEIQDLRQLIPKQFDVKGYCNVGQLEYRHILVRFDLFEDYVQFLSRSTGYVKSRGEEFFFRTFPWTMGFNPREETSKAVVWISMPELPANLFARKSLLSIAAEVGKPLAIDKSTKDRTRPSTARVKVLLDLTDKHPKIVRITIIDSKSGKLVEYSQVIVYDSLPKYCNVCKHQGHDENKCRWRIDTNGEEATVIAKEGLDKVLNVSAGLDKMQEDARDYLNAKRLGQLDAHTVKNNVFKDQGTQAEGFDIQNNGMDNTVAESSQAIMLSKIDKEPCPPSRDIPAKRALATVYNVVNPIVQAYDNLASAVKIMSNGAKTDDQVDVVEKDSVLDAVSADFSKSDHNVTDSKFVQREGNNDQLHSKAIGDGGELNTQICNLEVAEVEYQLLTNYGKPVGAQNLTNEKKGNRGVVAESKNGNLIHDDKGRDMVNNADGWKVVTRRESPTKLEVSLKKQNKVVRRIASEVEEQAKDTGQYSDREAVAQCSRVKKNGNKSSLEESTTGKLIKEDEVGDLNEKIGDWNEFSHRKSPTKNHISPKQQKKDVRRFDCNLVSNTNYFDVLAGSVDIQGEATCLHDQTMSTQLIAMCSDEQDGQDSDNLDRNKGVRPIDSNSNRDAELLSIQAHNSNAPTLHFSNPNIEKIIKDTQKEMMMKSTLDTVGEDAPANISINGKNAATNMSKTFTPKSGSNSKLNCKAPVFVPIGVVNPVSQNVASIDMGQKATIEQQQQCKGETSHGDREAAVFSKSVQQQIVITEPCISLEERQLLDAMVSTTPLKSLNLHFLSIGREIRRKTNLEGNSLVTQGIGQDLPSYGVMGRDILAEGEEEDILIQSRAAAARKGDISPRHSGRGKKSRTRDRSWDGMVNEDLNVRRLPMRVAKQRHAILTTSSKSNRSKKKT